MELFTAIALEAAYTQVVGKELRYYWGRTNWLACRLSNIVRRRNL